MFTGKPMQWTGRTRRSLAISKITAAMPLDVLKSTQSDNWKKRQANTKEPASWRAMNNPDEAAPLLDGITVLTKPAAERLNQRQKTTTETSASSASNDCSWSAKKADYWLRS